VDSLTAATAVSRVIYTVDDSRRLCRFKGGEPREQFPIGPEPKFHNESKLNEQKQQGR
jgi:hypothetical protein